jgi:TolA-binding protein
VKSFLRNKNLLPRHSTAIARNGTDEPARPETETTGEAGPTDKNEQRAASKLKFAKTLVDDGKLETAKTRFEEIIVSFPRTKAAEEAKLLLDKLNK